ncbi:MAG: hypothetical protein K0Q56_2306 [Sporolactobacillus laevolacticus]|jgi:hypothetical protein|nr:hypothetical protein [Sporolactobacillus laevolacticus]
MYGFVSCAYFKAFFLLNKRLYSFLLLIKNFRNSYGKVPLIARRGALRKSLSHKYTPNVVQVFSDTQNGQDMKWAINKSFI